MTAILGPETGASHVLVSAWLDPDLAQALGRAATDARDSRANYVRRVIIESLRSTGHLPAPETIPTPRRRRGTRRLEAAQ